MSNRIPKKKYYFFCCCYFWDVCGWDNNVNERNFGRIVESGRLEERKKNTFEVFVFEPKKNHTKTQKCEIIYSTHMYLIIGDINVK